MNAGDVVAKFTGKAGTTTEVFARRDRIVRPDGSTRPAYGWRKRVHGKVKSTNGQALEKYRAERQAEREAGPGARRTT